MADDARYEALVNDVNRRLTLVQAQVDELFARLESTNILAALAVHEEAVRLADQKFEALNDAQRRQRAGEEDLVG